MSEEISKLPEEGTQDRTNAAGLTAARLALLDTAPDSAVAGTPEQPSPYSAGAQEQHRRAAANYWRQQHKG